MTLSARAGTIASFGFAFAAAAALTGAPASAVVVCQKSSNPNKVKVRRECKPGENAVAVNDVYVALGALTELVDNADPVEIVVLPLPPGRYLVEATMRASAAVVELVHCTLSVGEIADSTSRLIDGNPLVGDPHDLVATVAVEITAADTAEVHCSATGGSDPGAVLQSARVVAQSVGRLVAAP